MAKRYGSEQVNGVLLKALMARNNLNPETLAKAAHIGLRTLQKMMASQRCNIDYIDMVSTALRVLPKDLMAKDPLRFTPQISPPTVEGKYYRHWPPQMKTPLHQVAREMHLLLSQYELDIPESSCQVGFYAMLDNAYRIPVVYLGLIGNNIDEPYWTFLGIKPSSYEIFQILLQHSHLNLDYFSPLGEILISGEGVLPDDVAWDEAAAMFGTKVHEFMDRKAVESQLTALYEKVKRS
jgi:hypothetical protein